MTALEALLANPAVQAGVAPFIVALIMALVARRWLPGWSGLAITGGFLVTVLLTTGIEFQPLTSTRKIILSSLILPVAFFLIDGLLGKLPTAHQKPVRTLRLILPVGVLFTVALWVIWPVLMRQEGAAAWLMGVRVGLYAVVVMAAALVFGQLKRPAHLRFSAQAANALLLGLGTGISSLIAASALYGQLAIAVAAGTGGIVLISLLSRSGHTKDLGNLALFAAAVPLALIGGAATVYAQLPWPVLLCLGLVPVFAGMPLFKMSNDTWRVTANSLWAGIPVLPAVWLAWRAAGPLSF